MQVQSSRVARYTGSTFVYLVRPHGWDAAKDPLHATNVARFETQLTKLQKSGYNVGVVYEAGPGTQKNIIAEKIDGATGYTSEQIAERTYKRIVDQAQEIYRRDPEAKLTIHAEGFSRGASQVPILARMIHDRGIPNLDRPEYVRDAFGNASKTFPHFHQTPGHTPISVGLYDPVPTGSMEKLDRRLPPSVISGFQINAADEKRGKFPVDRIIPPGASEDGRFLSVSVAGAHFDIGGSYLRNGLGTRSHNLMTDYHNALFSEPLLRRLPETCDPRLNVVHRSSIDAALREDSLVASDGKLYQRTAEGQWQRNGESVVAAGNLRAELDGTRAALQPQLALHEQQVAAIPTRQPPTLEDIERTDLMATYRVHNVNPNPQQLEAALEAVRRTQHEQGVAPLATSLHLGRNAAGNFDVDSPIEHIGRDADGANRVHAVTSPLEVQLAMLDLRSPPPTAPEPPELRIANLSPKQQEALEQVVREANRLGLTRDEVQGTARNAVAAATHADREPEIAISAIGPERPIQPPKPEVKRADEPAPIQPTNPIDSELAARRPPEPEPKAERNEEKEVAGPASNVASTQANPELAAASVNLATDKARAAGEQDNSISARQPESPAVSRPETDKPAVVGAQAASPAAPTTPVGAVSVAPVEAPAPPSPHVAPPAPQVATPVPGIAPTAPRAVAEATPPDRVAPPVASETGPAPDDNTLRRGDRGQDVELLQYRLQRVGYRGPDDAPVPERGHFDAATEHAVRTLQRDHGLAETGRVDPDTLQALALAQHAKIEAQKETAPKPEQAEVAQVARPTSASWPANEPAPPTYAASEPQRPLPVASTVEAPAASAPAIAGQEGREVDLSGVPARTRVSEMLADVGARESAQPENAVPPRTHGGLSSSEPANDRRETEREIARMSPADQAMFAKIRGAAPANVSDEVVAKAMLEAKRNGIPDVERLGQVGVVDGKLWIGSVTPGFHASVSTNGPAPNMQDTLKETQAVNQQNEQQLAQQAAQRNQDDPSRGPSR
ncbi:peptidoglycan-binding protein [Lysobacter firmicutimachus]|uniref:Peptidoglycan-binding protein n=1 Tax=Lysobacter firmicutimachus TaxID=1792846 RepID=A0AAU8MYW1_9GAMM